MQQVSNPWTGIVTFSTDFLPPDAFVSEQFIAQKALFIEGVEQTGATWFFDANGFFVMEVSPPPTTFTNAITFNHPAQIADPFRMYTLILQFVPKYIFLSTHEATETFSTPIVFTQRTVQVLVNCQLVGYNLQFTTNLAMADPLVETFVFKQKMFLMVDYNQVTISQVTGDANNLLQFTAQNVLPVSVINSIVSGQATFPDVYLIFPQLPIIIYNEEISFTWVLQTVTVPNFQVFELLQIDNPANYPVRPIDIVFQMQQASDPWTGIVTFSTDFLPPHPIVNSTFLAQKALFIEGQQQTGATWFFDANGFFVMQVSPPPTTFTNVITFSYPTTEILTPIARYTLILQFVPKYIFLSTHEATETFSTPIVFTQRTVQVLVNCQLVGYNLQFTTNLAMADPLVETFVFKQKMFLMVDYNQVTISQVTGDANNLLQFTAQNVLPVSVINSIVSGQATFPDVYLIFPQLPIIIYNEEISFTWVLQTVTVPNFQVFELLQIDDPANYPVRSSIVINIVP